MHADDQTTQDHAKGASKKTPRVKRYADEILKGDFFAQDAGGKLYRYAKGAYRAKGDEFIKHRVKRLCIQWGSDWSSFLGKEVCEFIRLDAPELPERPPVDLLNVQNGMLRISDRVLLEHSPEYLSSVQLPIEYDENADCPETASFVDDVFPKDAHPLAWQLYAWLMLPIVHIQKAVLLLGAGGEGKSTWLTAVRAFLGRENTCAASLHKLESNRFSVARLVGRLANCCPDLPSEHLASTNVFKALTDYTDPLEAEIKFGKQFDCRPFSRLVFSANHAPRSGDNSTGFFDRWLVIPFGHRFRGEQEEIPRHILDAKLAQPTELSGVLNRALDALPHVMEHGLSEPPSVQEANAEFRATTDPFAVWLDLETIDDSNAIVLKADLRRAWAEEAQRRGMPTWSDANFSAALARERPHVKKAQRTVGGKPRQHVYLGIGLRPPIRRQRTRQDRPRDPRRPR